MSIDRKTLDALTARLSVHAAIPDDKNCLDKVFQDSVEILSHITGTASESQYSRMELRKLLAACYRLTDSLAAFCDFVRPDLDSDADNLQAEVFRVEKNLRQTHGRREELYADLTQKNDHLASMTREWQELTMESIQLEEKIRDHPLNREAKRVSALKEQLAELESCDPEQLLLEESRLQKQLSEQDSSVLLQKERIRDLKKRSSELSGLSAQLSGEYDHELKTVLEQVTVCANLAAPTVDRTLSDLREQASRCDAILRDVKECERIRREYSSWFKEDQRLANVYRTAFAGEAPLTCAEKNGQRFSLLDREILERLHEYDSMLKDCSEEAARGYSSILERIS